jgi:hypothetical protein
MIAGSTEHKMPGNQNRVTRMLKDLPGWKVHREGCRGRWDRRKETRKVKWKFSSIILKNTAGKTTPNTKNSCNSMIKKIHIHIFFYIFYIYTYLYV